MINKFRFKKCALIALLCALASICCLALCSCGEGESVKKYDYLVTFDYNTGKTESNCKNQYLGVLEGSLVGIQPGDNENFRKGEVPGYYLEGWYIAKTDADGNVIKNEETGRAVLDTKWDFASMRVNGNMTLYANFVRTAIMRYIDADLYDAADPLNEAAILDSNPEMPGTVLKKPTVLAPEKDGYTLFGYYSDAECTIDFTWPCTVATDDITVFVKFIEGNWNIVDSEEALIKALAKGGNIYLTKDLDFSSAEWVYGDYNAEFNGNGHKISGITLKRVCDRRNFGAGIFGELGQNAYVHDLVIENATIEFKVAFSSGEFKAGFFAYSAKEGARVSNVTVDGTLYYDYGSNVTSSVYEWIAEGSATTVNCDYTGVKTEEKKIGNN